jgi:hypothetical protein
MLASLTYRQEHNAVEGTLAETTAMIEPHRKRAAKPLNSNGGAPTPFSCVIETGDVRSDNVGYERDIHLYVVAGDLMAVPEVHQSF